MRSVEFACIFRGNVATGNLPVKPPQRSDLNQLASLIPGAIHYDLLFEVKRLRPSVRLIDFVT